MNTSQVYLKQHCPDKDLKLCVVLSDGFDPWDWSPHGTIAKVGGHAELERELDLVCADIMKDPALVAQFLMRSSLNWAKQFVVFSKPVENIVSDSITDQGLKEFNVFEFHLYSKQVSKGYDSSIHENVLRTLSHLFLLFVLISICIFFLLAKKLSQLQIRFFILLLAALLLNSLVCGVLTEPNDRYQGRLIFLFPLFTFYILGDQLTRVLNKGSTGRDVSPQTMS